MTTRIDRRKAIFLSEVERDIYQVLSDLCSPDKAASKTLDQLLNKLQDHFEQVPNEMAGHGYRKITKASPTHYHHHAVSRDATKTASIT